MIFFQLINAMLNVTNSDVERSDCGNVASCSNSDVNDAYLQIINALQKNTSFNVGETLGSVSNLTVLS